METINIKSNNVPGYIYNSITDILQKNKVVNINIDVNADEISISYTIPTRSCDDGIN